MGLSISDDSVELLFETLEVLDHHRVLADEDVLTLKGVNHSLGVLVVLPVGPHDVSELEVVNGQFIAADPLRLVLKQLGGHLFENRLSSLKVSVLGFLIVLAHNGGASHLAPLFEKEIESSVNVPSGLGLSRVVSEFLREESSKSVCLVKLNILVNPAWEATWREGGLKAAPLFVRKSLVFPVNAGVDEH